MSIGEPTPGPWTAVIANDEQPSLLYAGIITTLHYSPDPDGYVAVVADHALGMGGASLLEECQANARLIAAAPLMQEALEAEELAHAWYQGCIGGDLDDKGRELFETADRLRRAALAAASPPARAAADGRREDDWR